MYIKEPSLINIWEFNIKKLVLSLILLAYAQLKLARKESEYREKAVKTLLKKTNAHMIIGIKKINKLHMWDYVSKFYYI